jgi:hypothetical protein
MESIPENLEALLRSLAGDALTEDKYSKKVQHSSGQVMRLLLNATRTEQGYRGAEVLVGPSRTEEAYDAAALALHGEEMEREDEDYPPGLPEEGEASHRRLACCKGVAFDLHVEEELHGEAYRSEPQDPYAYLRHYVGPEDELAGAEGRGEDDHARPNDLPQRQRIGQVP